MRRFLVNITLFGIIFFVLEKVFYIFLYFSPKLESDSRLEIVLQGNLNKEVVVLGSSRGARNIIANLIEDSLGLSTYNLSYPGSDIEFHEFILRTLVKFNKSPKCVLLTVDDAEEFYFSEYILFRLDRLYPLSKYGYINNELIQRGEKSFLSKIIVLARINKSNFDLAKKEFSSLDIIDNSGSMPLDFQKENLKMKFVNIEKTYSKENELENKLMAFKNLQSICSNNEIKLFIVFSPNYYKASSTFEQRIRELSNSNVSFIRHNASNLNYSNKDFFYDEGHLKKNGAEEFTKDIIVDLKLFFNKKR